MNPKQKLNLLSRTRGFLNPVEWEEPVGRVMIEAMALGRPVISFARSAAPEIVVHGSTGFLVQHLDEMAQALPKIDEIDRETARLRVERHFSAGVMAESYLHMYEQVIAGSKEASGCKRTMFDQEGTSKNEKIPSARSI